MYAFEDLSKRRIVLRPEGTAGVIRHVLNSDNNTKLHYLKRAALKYFYAGPMFRYERPQTGRMRQFYQMGLENINDSDSNYSHDAGI